MQNGHDQMPSIIAAESRIGHEMLNGGGLIPLFTELRPALARFLQTRGASADEAEDILQDVNIKLLAERSGPVAQPRA
jgi:RNA polymerase sigma-70 factor (ECF subfamily)